MIHYLKHILLAFCSVFCLTSLPAQNQLKIIWNETSFAPDSGCYGDHFDLDFYIKNEGTTDVVSMQVMMKSSPVFPYLLDSVSATVAPGDSFHYVRTDSFTVARFSGGINIVVIWPESPGFITVDSLKDTALIDCSSPVDDPALLQGWYVYPNPSADGMVWIKSPMTLRGNTQVTVLDVHGSAVLQTQFTDRALDLRHLPAGVWFLRIQPQGEPPRTLRFIK